MSVEYNCYHNQFRANGKWDRHVSEEHVFMMIVGECHMHYGSKGSWTSANGGKKQADKWLVAPINIMHDYGEVKAQSQAHNLRLIGIDLMYVTFLTKAASDKYRSSATFAYIVVRKLPLCSIG
ncbi:hypothetical protein CU098_004830 [Rhizopus stolonifer]|uniref:Uncharacterized protein n=1 Tax=Rhizopus stolonifer TaxID=4846 RepID=A0A367KXL7_RHIST|nr:hypothetical protein CU098_004830 [Rhizopus stolonifer]